MTSLDRTASAKKTILKDLRGLKALKLEIENRTRLAAEQQAARLAAARQLKAEKELFSHSIGPIKALPVRHGPGQKAQISIVQPAPIPVQLQLDEQAVMREALSDEFDGDALLDTDEALSFRRPGIGVDVVRKLRRGAWRIQGQLDLHGLRRDDARDTLSKFIREAQKTGWRCVRVVHGKGLGSPGKTPVLKGRVQSWLIQKIEVLAFAQARPAEGGAGALVVLLAPG
ncbi:MAG: DNA-nicking Smr family endonuclease [Polaromonas sp.]|jgi:DNA-nicking Smr family endonuclease